MNEEFALNLDFSHANINEEEIDALETKIKKLDVPFFAGYEPDFAPIRTLAEKLSDKKNIIIEGNGGSISTLRAFYSCFGAGINKNVFLLDTSDPDYLSEIRQKCAVADTALIVTSKSGESIDALVGYLALAEYETVFITGGKGALYDISRVEGIEILNHPEISGRFSGITECALFPAQVLGIDAEAVTKGAKTMYARCAPASPFADNPALQFALSLDKLEKVGYTELFLSMYSKKLTGFFELITQLFHESVCKDGKGQTIYGGEAPENQHHTLQRFNSGRQNSVGVFLTEENFQNDLKFVANQEIKDIECRNIKIGQLERHSMQDIIHTEFEGTWQDTVEKGIPAVHIELKVVSPQTVGELIAFFQYAAFYSAILRKVNPFDQPGVERSKEYIFKLIEGK